MYLNSRICILASSLTLILAFSYFPEGIREKDRKNITPVLKQVSSMKDNCYNLLRHIWNDVSEDWPYYSEQERQSFRRRKPQNLTPPCSDGSTSSSGHSPHSSHHTAGPASTSTVVGRGPGGAMVVGGNKRRSPSMYDPAHGPGLPESKKKRMSNYVRPSDSKYMSGHESSSPAGHTPTSSSNSALGKSPRFGVSPRGGGGQGQGHHQRASGGQKVGKSLAGASGPGVVASTNYDSAGSGADDIEPNFSGVGGVTGGPSWEEYTPNSSPDSREGDSQMPEEPQQQQPRAAPAPPSSTNFESQHAREEKQQQQQQEQQQEQQQASSEMAGLTQTSASAGLSEDYVTEFVPITSHEQRMRYKETFNGEYAQYRKLHADLSKVTKKFAALEAKLNQERAGSESWQVRLKKEFFQDI